MELWVCISGQSEYFLADVQNLSAGGFLIKSPFPLEKGQDVTCKMELPQQEELTEFTAHICYIKAEDDYFLAGMTILECVSGPTRTFKAQLEALFI